MQFSDTTNKNGLIQLSEALCNLGDAGISGDTTLLKQFTGYLNQAYSEVVMAIMSVDKTWKFDDFNYTDIPEAPITMVNAQRDYTLPVASTGADVATLLRVNKVWVLDATGNRIELQPMGPEDDFDRTTTGIPSRYRLDGKSIFLDPRPATGSVTLTSGLIIQFQRVPDAFASSGSDTQQPGFMATYHDLLPLKASSWYLLPIKPDLASAYEQRFLSRLELLKRDYAMKDDNTPRRMTPAMHDNR